MGKVKLFIMTALVAGLTFALAGTASAVTMGTCGGCHGTTGTSNPLPNNSDNCTNNARGLHGTHTNFSTSYFTGKTNTVAPTTYTRCAYCHVSTTVKAPSLRHNNGYINVTGSDSGGKATGLSYNSGTKTCTSACHKNRGNTAKWGNYTATTVGSIKLSCFSCHDDVTYKATINLTGQHLNHLNSVLTLTAKTAMGAANNAGCINCHPDNTGDFWKNGKADDGSKQAYPHALGGANGTAMIVSDNASLLINLSSTRVAGSADTCNNACHKNNGTAQPKWNDTILTCDACHYYNAAVNYLNNSTARVKLVGAHGRHFRQNKQCTNCHAIPGAGDTTHVTALPSVSANATVNLTTGGGGSFATGPKTCTGTTSTGCHGPANTTPSWYTTVSYGCSVCHNYPGGTNGKDWTVAGNGHYVKYSAASATNTHLRDNSTYNKMGDTYTSVVSNTNLCGKCHYGTGNLHQNNTVNMVASGNGLCGANFIITVTSTGNNVTCGSVKCHNGKATPNWW